MSVSLLHWGAQHWTLLQVCPPQCWAEGKNLPPWCAGSTSPDAAQDRGIFLCSQGTANLVSTRIPGSFSTNLLSLWVVSSTYWCVGLFLTRNAGLCISSCWACWGPQSFWACFSSLSRPFRVAAQLSGHNLSKVCVISKLAAGTLCFTLQATNKEF